MTWYDYPLCFISGSFLTNALPHLLHGISGDRFPTPYAKPPGQGLSSPMTNTLWGLFNLLLGLILLRTLRNPGSHWDVGSFYLFFAGIAVTSIFSSWRFKTKHKD